LKERLRLASLYLACRMRKWTVETKIVLTFADVVLELNQIEAAIEREAVMIEDVYRDLDQYGSSRTLRTQELVVDYVQAVIDVTRPVVTTASSADDLPRPAHNLAYAG